MPALIWFYCRVWIGFVADHDATTKADHGAFQYPSPTIINMKADHGLFYFPIPDVLYNTNPIIVH